MNLQKKLVEIPKKIKMFNFKKLIHENLVQSKANKVIRIKKKILNKNKKLMQVSILKMILNFKINH